MYSDRSNGTAGPLQSIRVPLALLQKAQAGFDDFARRGKAALVELPGDEILEMIRQFDRLCLGHLASSDGIATLKV